MRKGHAKLVKTSVRKNLMTDFLFRNLSQFAPFVLIERFLFGNLVVALPQQAVNFFGDELLLMGLLKLFKERTSDPSPAVVRSELAIGHDEHTRIRLLHHHLA